MSVQDKTVIVTGGASGIGRASALLLAEQGAKVVVADRDAGGARRVREEIEGEFGDAIDLAVDVGNSTDVARMVSQSIVRYGRIDVLLHAAGVCPRKHVLDLTDDEWRDVLRINLDGTFYVTREVAKVMVEQKNGTMILITSDRGIYGSIDYAHYAASKGGMIALTKSLALALGTHGVTVNAINPGLTDTPLARANVTGWQSKTEIDVLGKVSQPAEIAQTVLFLAGIGGAYMTGQMVSTRMRFGQ
jgi:NAD(P)-dependent dehydrogenase (short-subunit alcohol dehydrogenase family)